MTKVVVIGGGYAGAFIVKDVAKMRGVEVVLIDPKECHHHVIAAVRAIVDEETAARHLIPFDGILVNGARHIRSFATGIDVERRTVSLSDGSEVPYDVCVVASGSRYADPFRLVDGEDLTRESMLAVFAGRHERLREAHKVVVVGGGATGVEVSAEIKAAFPDKPVTLAHRGDRLCNTDPRAGEKDSETIRTKLSDLGVDVELNSSVDLEDVPAWVEIVLATGGKPLTSFVPAQFLDDSGYIVVNAALQMCPGVLAAGDVVAGHAPTAQVAQYLHAPLIVSHIKQIVKSGSWDGLKPAGKVPGPMAGLLMSIGPRDHYGTGILFKMFGSLKSKDLLIARARKELNVK